MIRQFGLYIKKNHVILLAFFIPVLIPETAYIANGIFPFGKWDIFIIDLYHQYAPFISDFQDKIRSFSSILYSWSGGLTVYTSIIFIIIYGVSLTVDRSLSISPSRKALIIFIVMAAEITANTIAACVAINYTEGYQNRDGYASGKEVSEIRSEVSRIAVEDKGFCRLEILPHKTSNDPALYNYRGLSIFSSTAPAKTVKMLVNLGFESNGINSYRYDGSTVILDSLLDIKYLIYRSINIDEKLYTKTATTDELTVFTNPYALPLGFQADGELKNFFSSQGTQRYIYKRINKDKESIARIQFSIDEFRQAYLYYKAPYNMKGSGFVMVNDKKVEFDPGSIWRRTYGNVHTL